MRLLRAGIALACLFLAFINHGNGLWSTVPSFVALVMIGIETRINRRIADTQPHPVTRLFR